MCTSCFTFQDFLLMLAIGYLSISQANGQCAITNTMITPCKDPTGAVILDVSFDVVGGTGLAYDLDLLFSANGGQGPGNLSLGSCITDGNVSAQIPWSDAWNPPVNISCNGLIDYQIRVFDKGAPSCVGSTVIFCDVFNSPTCQLPPDLCDNLNTTFVDVLTNGEAGIRALYD